MSSRQNNNVQWNHLGNDYIVESLLSRSRKKEDGSLTIIEKQIIERSDGDIRGVVVCVRAREFIDLILDSQARNVKRHIFSENLRVFLGPKKGFNPEIIGTASSQAESYLFWYLNNGITITCSNFQYNKGHANSILRFSNFQIVNGAQTSHSLLLANEQNGAALDDVVLLLRIYATDRADVAERVAIATNSQARIQGRDLRANHRLLKIMDESFQLRGYFLETKKGMYSNENAENVIDALKLGQIIISYFDEEPEKAKTDSDSIFQDRFESVFSSHRSVDQLVSLFEIYKHIEALRDTAVFGKQKWSDRKDYHLYVSYGSWFILYVLKLMYDEEAICSLKSESEIREVVDTAVCELMRVLSKEESFSFYQAFRSTKTKMLLVSKIRNVQYEFGF